MAQGSGDTFLLAESEAIWRALRKAWNDDVYLPELAARFWRLTLQVRPCALVSCDGHSADALGGSSF